MMPGKARVYLAVVAVIAAAVAVGVVSAGASTSTSATASTTACGSACTSLAMAAASTANTGQDFALEEGGTVGGAVSDGSNLLPSKLILNYSQGFLVEFQYAPGGVPSGNCMADGTNAPNTTENDVYYAPNTSITLATCGLTLATLWIVDPNNGINTNGYDDLINAGYAVSDTYSGPEDTDGQTLTSPYADPDVLTVNSSGKVVLAELSEIGGVVSPGQMWFGGPALVQLQAREAAAKSAAARQAAGKS